MLPAALFLVLLVTLVRVVGGIGSDQFGWMTHFTPIAALAVCAGIYLGRRMAWLITLLPFAISDVILNLHYGLAPIGVDFVVRLATLAGMVWLAALLGQSASSQNHSRALPSLGGSVLGSVLFYLVVNTVCWFGPDYAHTFAGWVQAQTLGVPGFPPAYWFLVKSLASDLVFAGIFVAAMELSVSRTREPSDETALLSFGKFSRK